MPRSRAPFLLLFAFLAIALSPISCFAFPQYEQKIPAEAFVAAAGGDVAALPDNCPPITTKSVWYDREVSFAMNGTKADGSPYALDFTSASNGSNALEARRSDNDRSVANLAATFGLLKQLAQFAAASQGVPIAGGTAATAPSPASDERLRALEERLDALTKVLDGLKAPTPSVPEVTLPPDNGANGAGPPEG